MIQRIIVAAVALVAVGLLVFLFRLSQTFDVDEHNARLDAMRALKQLDGRLNEETLRARVSLDPDSTALVDLLPEVQAAVNKMLKGPTSLKKKAGPEVDKALGAYVKAMAKKIELADNFDSQNLLLIGSIDRIYQVGNELLNELPKDRPDDYTLILRTSKATLEFGLLPIRPNSAELADLGTQVSKLAPSLAGVGEGELQFKAVQFGSNVNNILSTRVANDKLLADIFATPTDKTLTSLQTAYDKFHSKRLDQAEFFRQILGAYAVFLLLGIAFLVFRLRGSYVALNKANAGLAEANTTLEQKVAVRTQDLSKAYDALKTSQTALVQGEKMASLGQMVAGVTHEINTPLGYVKSNFQLVHGMFGDLHRLVADYARAMGLIRSPDAPEAEINKAFEAVSQTESEVDPAMFEEASQLLEDSAHGLDQISELITNLKNFSRLDRSRMDMFDVNKGLDATLSIAKHLLRDRITVHKEYGRLPNIQCAPSQINQVFLNLLTNASQAISGQGDIKIVTRTRGENVEISIEDSGCGMPPEVLAKIYEPFFTTKEVGKGTGLGMSIVFQIIKEHGGRIDGKSEIGKGSRFVITLPQRQGSANDSTEAQAVENKA